MIHNGIPLRAYRRQFVHPDPGSASRIKPGEPLIGLLGKITPMEGRGVLHRDRHPVGGGGRPAGLSSSVPSRKGETKPLPRPCGNSSGKRPHGPYQLPPRPPMTRPLLSQLDVLLHCSVKPEPFGRVIIEGMAVGVPVIAARDGGVPEIITPWWTVASPDLGISMITSPN